MYTLDLNGTIHRVEQDMKLLEYLREEARLTSAKDGCGEGACGACMVLVDGKATRACLLTVAKAEGKKIQTLEGFSDREKDVYVWAFDKAGAVQCGFCFPGMVVSAKGLLDVKPSPTESEIRVAIRGNICRCTGYVKIVEAIQFAAKMLRENTPVPSSEDRVYHVGERMSRVDNRDKVLGKASFVDDTKVPGMLYAAVLRSPSARAYIRTIDISDAKKHPGVVSVLTAADVPGLRHVGHIKKDWAVMIAEGEETRYIGDSLAIVAATTKKAAREAVALIKLDYENRKPITTVDEALAPDAHKIHPNGNRVAVNATVLRGDVDAALAQSAHVVTETFNTPFVEHAFMEPESALAYFDEDGILRVYTAGQSVYDDHHGITDMLGVESEKVRVITKYVGGGFGGKEDLSVQHHAALLAWHTKKPVRLTLTRQESINVHPKRHPMRMAYTVGCDAEGRITAARIRIHADTGAYSSLGGPVLQRACTHAGGPYRIPNVDIEGVGAYTNNPPAGAFRGFGVTQSAFAIESMLNRLADKVGISYWEIRDRNVVEPGDTLPNGQIVSPDCAVRETLRVAKAAFESSPYAGIACGLKNSGTGVGLSDVGRVRLDIKNGGVIINTSAACIGQGLASTLVQIASHTLNMPISKISCAIPDTYLTPNSGTTTASRQTVFTGEAVRMACDLLLKDLGAQGGKLEALEGKEYYSEFDYKTDPIGSDKPNPVSHLAYSYATHVCILDGAGKVKKFVAVHDVGQAINPANVEGQIDGGIAMGLGYALTEDLKLVDGVPTAKLGTLGIWRANDMPEIERHILERKADGFAYGAKGVGEIVLVPPAPAIALAYERFDGKKRNSLPLEDTPYRKKKA